ncbi:MAG: HDIG domain-containing protein [Thermaerobacter sp.]|nr:HDIG domain-containing protein [Thermaerobacter sp.]
MNQMAVPSRETAWHLLNRYTKNPNLIKHALAVEAVMQALARHYGEDPASFGLVGLLHDFDYESYPEIGQHTIAGAAILREAGFSETIVRAVQSHVTENGIARTSLLEKAIYAVDELTGFVVAVTLVRPQQSLSQVTAASVKKKLKDKSFARTVNRADVTSGAEGLGMDLDTLIEFVIESLKPHAESLGIHP